MHKGRVLIVEDESLISMMLQEHLESEGYECASADTVDGALRLIGSQSFAAAVVDVNLNGELSYPLAKALKTAHVPCIFSSGYAHATVPVELGHLPHLEKPYEMTAVVKAIEHCIARAEH